MNSYAIANQMLISVCREYIEATNVVKMATDDETYRNATRKQDAVKVKLIEMAADRDKVAATSDSYNYALAVIALSEAT